MSTPDLGTLQRIPPPRKPHPARRDTTSHTGRLASSCHKHTRLGSPRGLTTCASPTSLIRSHSHSPHPNPLTPCPKRCGEHFPCPVRQQPLPFDSPSRHKVPSASSTVSLKSRHRTTWEGDLTFVSLPVYLLRQHPHASTHHTIFWHLGPELCTCSPRNTPCSPTSLSLSMVPGTS